MIRHQSLKNRTTPASQVNQCDSSGFYNSQNPVQKQKELLSANGLTRKEAETLMPMDPFISTDPVLSELEKMLENHRNLKNQEFFCRLSPNLSKDRVLGIKIPVLTKIAKSLMAEQKEALLQAPARKFYEEDMLVVLILNQIKDPQEAFEKLDLFLPALNNWSLTDGLSFPKLSDDLLLEKASSLLSHSNSWAVRLGIVWIMKRGIHPVLDQKKVQKALAVSSEAMEIKMALGWLLCEGMIWHPDWFADRIYEHPDRQVQRIAISKCIGSRRIPGSVKKQLKEYRKKNLGRTGRKDSALRTTDSSLNAG